MRHPFFLQRDLLAANDTRLRLPRHNRGKVTQPASFARVEQPASPPPAPARLREMQAVFFTPWRRRSRFA